MKLCPECFGPLVGHGLRCLHCEGERQLAPAPVPPRLPDPVAIATDGARREPVAEPGSIMAQCPICGGQLNDITFVCRVCNNALVRFEPGNKAPNCTQCRYFGITHQREWPRMCRVFNFKGQEMPSYFVFNVTGKHCPFFAENNLPAS
jgi:hypothetical protein